MGGDLTAVPDAARPSLGCNGEGKNSPTRAVIAVRITKRGRLPAYGGMIRLSRSLMPETFQRSINLTTCPIKRVVRISFEFKVSDNRGCFLSSKSGKSFVGVA